MPWLLLLMIIGFVIGMSSMKPMNDYSIQPVPFTSVKVTDEFWAPRIKRNHDVTIPIAFEKSRETGRIKNFKVAGGLEDGSFCSLYPFDDSDVFKIVEGACYSIQTYPDPDLEAYIDTLVYYFGEAQEDDGYLYTNRTILGDSAHKWAGNKRWELVNELSHELYNLGHMFEAAVAHYQATGKRSFLNIAIKAADLVDRDFGPGKIELVPGHQEIEIGLVKLYRVTGDKRYLDLAKFFLEARGPDGEAYSQAHEKVIDQNEAIGHVVRAMYMYSAMADVAALENDDSYTEAIDKIWEDVVFRKYYITGGVGASRHGEAFGKAYELPNLEAYCETCAAIGNVFWNYRLFLLHGTSGYYDVLERTLYNGLISGVSLSGDRFFYPNPLESYGQHERSPWFGCACCPANITRFIPSIPGYIYAKKADRLYINLFIESTADIELNGEMLEIEQKTRYPWEGIVEIELKPEKATTFELFIRIPGWALNRPVPGDLYRFYEDNYLKATLFVNNQKQEITLQEGYVVLKQKWNRGDIIRLELPMPVRKIIAHEKVKADSGRVALQRGPVVYCLEWPDNINRQVSKIKLDPETKLSADYRPDLLDGIYVINGITPGHNRISPNDPEIVFHEFTAIPYYAWANRGPGEMTVWMVSF